MSRKTSSLGNNLQERRSRLAFLYAVPIGLLGGLIGLGGAEFRLPVLAGLLKYSVSQAVPLNLAVSLVTLFVSLIIRSSTLSCRGFSKKTVLLWRILAGILFGLAIGLVSSLLSVAGGELIIPTLVFAFGADIKRAGTASLLVSLPKSSLIQDAEFLT